MIAVIGKPKAHHGGAETRRRKKQTSYRGLTRMIADHVCYLCLLLVFGFVIARSPDGPITRSCFLRASVSPWWVRR